MGAGSSVEVPGGGTEGYHVLRVSINGTISANRIGTMTKRNSHKLVKTNTLCVAR